MPNELPQKPGEQRLDSWKEIAAFFGRDERTVKRWEKERGLPVHRVPGGGRGTVFAFSEELAGWLRSSSQKAMVPAGESQPSTLPTRDVRASDSMGHGGAVPLPRPRRWVALALVLIATILGVIGFSRFVEIRSVQGRILSGLGWRYSSSAHKEAEELYLQGRYHWNKRTADDLSQALEDFTKSAERDPNYALAYAGQADCYDLLREYTSMPAAQAFPLALAAAHKAVELDDSLPEGHRALGFAYFHWDWNVARGEQEFRRAIELNPNDVEAHHWYATALLALARYPEAIEEIERARKLDPTSSSIAADRATILYSSGHTQEGISILQELEKADPNFISPHAYLAGMYLDEKQFEKSFAESEMLARLNHDEQAVASVAAGRARFDAGGEHEFLEGLLMERLQEFKQGRMDAIAVASAYARLGDKKETLEYLNKAYQRHDYALIFLESWRQFSFLREEPEFQSLLLRLNPTESASRH
jgi:tetratricopeptide (TPR) repeat protein